MPNFHKTLLSLSIVGVLSNTALAEEYITESSQQLPTVLLDTEYVTVERANKQSLGVSKISETDIESSGVKSDISELVRKMPGVNLTGNSATGQRGNNRQIDIRGMGPENTLILIDGRPVTSRNAVRYGWRGERDTRGDSQWIPAGAIQSIEVLRGPAAARYGNGAMGGVVNIITKPVTDEMHGSAEIYTSQPENNKEGASYRANFNLSGPIVSDTLGFRLYGGYNKTEMDDVDINPLVSYNRTALLTRAAGREGVVNKDAGLNLTWDVNNNHQLSFDASYSEQNNEYAGDVQNSNRDAADATANQLLNSLIGETTNKMKRQSYALTHEGIYTWGDSQIVAQYDKTKNSRLNEGLAGSTEGAITSLDFEDSDLSTFRLSAQANMPLDTKLNQTITVGAEYVADELIDRANTTEGEGGYADLYTSGDRTKMNSKIISAFIEDSIAVTDDTQVTVSARVDHHDKTGTNFSPSLSVFHNLGRGWSAKAGIGRAYKAPNLYQSTEGYLLGTRGNGCPISLGRVGWCVLQGNENLKPETSLNTELGVQYQDDKYNATLTYFHNDYKDKIVSGTELISQTALGANAYNLLKWENTPKAVVSGIEGSLSAKWDDWTWSNNLTYMIESEDKTTGNPLSMIPDYTLNSTLSYAINDQWDANVSYTQYGRQQPRQFAQSNVENTSGDGLLHNPVVKSYGIASIGAGYRFNEYINARFGVNNLFDKQVLRDHSLSQTYNEPGRAYYASLHYDF